MTDLSVDALLLPEATRQKSEINATVVAVATTALAAGAVTLSAAYSWRQGALFLLGGYLGIVLYHALFGFTSAWRIFIADRRGAGLRAQMLMLALAVVLFYPALAVGHVFGIHVHGEMGAVGTSVVVGAFLFGLGMQLGGACASGTLYTAGGGNTRMLVTLAAFIIGSVIGTEHFNWWAAMPNVGPVSMIATLGWLPALLVNLAIFAAVAGLTVVLERRKHGRLVATRTVDANYWRRIVRGPWPLAWGAIGLALGNFATLLLAGRPWGITSGFALWGAKIWVVAGADVASWPYWQVPARAASLHQSVFADITSIMDLGIMIGAMLAAGLAGKFKPSWYVPLRSLAAAALGGFLLGYGARLAYGCNIGAYFSGIASASLHGWVWFVAALLGSVVGTRLRPYFGLSVERSQA
jgi:uncharacterized protein